MKLTDKKLVDYIWREAIDDNLGFAYAVNLLRINHKIKITAEEAETRFNNYLKTLTGIAPTDKCPLCGSKLVPKRKYGYFIACSAYWSTGCKFTAGKNKRYISKEEN